MTVTEVATTTPIYFYVDGATRTLTLSGKAMAHVRGMRGRVDVRQLAKEIYAEHGKVTEELVIQRLLPPTT